LRDAVAAALVQSPELAAFSAEVRAREAAALQAGLLPNPVLRTDLEDFGGSGRRAAFHSAQTTISLAQLVELGGKRAKRRRVASLEADLAGWDYEARRATVLAEVTKAFVGVLAAQERLALADELVRVAAASVRTVGDQVRAGAVSPIEQERAEVALDRERLERVQLEHDLAAAKATLAAAWGARTVTFTAVRGDLAHVTAPPPEAEFLATVDANPDLARWATELAQRAAALDLAKARRIPDLTVGVGGRHFDEDDTSGAVVELSIPLPIFDRNQGGIAEAHERLAKAKAEQAAAEAAVRSALGRAYQDLHAAWDRVVSLRDRVIPRARAVFRGADDAYQRGLYRWLEVLDAQRTLFAVRDQYIQALAAYHVARADVERLSGTPTEERP
jgi:cobalt-zinc-cadmium efflux system outer membrane protein